MTKYRAQPVTVDGIRFASKKEAKRYGELDLMEKAGTIERLELQPEYRCIVNGVEVCKYVADFKYLRHGVEWVVEDVKGYRTPVYRLKKKLVEALYPGVKIVEV